MVKAAITSSEFCLGAKSNNKHNKKYAEYLLWIGQLKNKFIQSKCLSSLQDLLMWSCRHSKPMQSISF